MLTFQEETIRGLIPEAAPILFTQWKELANYQDTRPLDPDFDKYIKLNEMKIVRAFTAREDKELLGYFVFLINPHLHYKTWKAALSDVYYVEPSKRGKGIGAKFFQEMEAWLKSLEVNCIIVQEKVKHSHGEMFKALGYSMTERQYEKVI